MAVVMCYYNGATPTKASNAEYSYEFIGWTPAIAPVDSADQIYTAVYRPVLNTYTNYKIAWNGKFFFLYAALFILVNSLGSVSALQLLVAVAGIAMIVVDIKQHVKMAKCFGMGAGTGILLILFPGITSLVLGLGKAEFQK